MGVDLDIYIRPAVKKCPTWYKVRTFAGLEGDVLVALVLWCKTKSARSARGVLTCQRRVFHETV